MMGSPDSEIGRFASEGPQRPVTIGYKFAVSRHEVTFADWDACVEDGDCEELPDRRWGRGRNPLINVSWEQTRAFLRWLRARVDGAGYRLLSESEWEYVARAGTQTAWYWGDGPSEQCRYANGYDRSLDESPRGGRIREGREPVSCDDGHAETAPVGSYEPNGFGLYDLLGNVWEWTRDCWNESYAGGPDDGAAWEAGDCSRRVVRGGSFVDVSEQMRAAHRSTYFQNDGGSYIGFRVARTFNECP